MSLRVDIKEIPLSADLTLPNPSPRIAKVVDPLQHEDHGNARRDPSWAAPSIRQVIPGYQRIEQLLSNVRCRSTTRHCQHSSQLHTHRVSCHSSCEDGRTNARSYPRKEKSHHLTYIRSEDRRKEGLRRSFASDDTSTVLCYCKEIIGVKKRSTEKRLTASEAQASPLQTKLCSSTILFASRS